MEQKHNLGSLLNGAVNESKGSTDMASVAQSQVDNFMAGHKPVATIDEDNESATIMAVSKEDFENAIPITAEDAEREAVEKIKQNVNHGYDDMMKTLDDGLAEEDARIARLDELGTEAYQKASHGARSETTDTEEARKVSQDELRRSSGDPDYTIVPDEDFVPDFGEDEDEVKEINEKASTQDVDDDEDRSNADAVLNVLGTAPTVEFSNGPKDLVSVVRDRHMKTEIISTGRFESKSLADQAFINSVNKFKAKNFRTVRVPLINSGFFVDMVGTGSNDLVMFYDSSDQNISAAEYAMNRMKTIMKACVGAEPKVNPNELKNLIHNADYRMMSYGYVCATLEEIVFPHTCEKCNHTFKVKTNPAEMLLNADKMEERIQRIRSAKNASDNSLMAKEVKLSFDSGFEVTVGHSSYYDEVVMLNALNHYIQTLKPIEAAQLARLSNNLLYIKKISLPNGLKAANVYQTFKALQLMNLDEYSQVMDAIKTLTDMIITPKIGVSDVECPHCKEVIKSIELDSVEELVFFHSMVIQAEKENTKKK